MGTISTAFNIATGALDADQSALDIVANNTANANTPGYTVETPTWQQNDSVTLGGVNYGMGVQVTGAESQRNRVLERAMQQQTQTESSSAARLTALDQVQALFSGATTAANGSATGIGSDLDSFFGALSSLEADPADDSLRQQVLSTAGTLASDFNSTAAQLSSQRQSLDEQSTSIVGQVNTLLANVAQLNKEIQSDSPSQDAGTLEDQRQQDLTELSQLIGVDQITTEDNGLTITTAGGALLVSEGQACSITSGQSQGVTHFYDSQGNDITADLTAGGGELGGILTARDQDIPQVQNSLDTLAYAMGSQINTASKNGVDMNGAAGGDIFTLPSSAPGSAAQIAVAITDPTKIAAAASGEGSSDNANAVAMADLANSGIVAGVTPGAYFSDLVTSLGSLVSEVSSENTGQQAALTQLQNQIGSISGVNLNDEAASLETLEQSYEAASKMFSILDQVMTAALNLGVETTYSS